LAEAALREAEGKLEKNASAFFDLVALDDFFSSSRSEMFMRTSTIRREV